MPDRDDLSAPADRTAPDPGLAVPGDRVSRVLRLGSLAAGIAGNMITEGTRSLAAGQRPRMQDLLLTPGNAMKVTQTLAQMRGAAMKVGQLLSMDAGDLLPRELADILAGLRSDARPMPPKQLDGVLVAAWGRDWRRRFARFDVTPIAAASIGQVHRGVLKDGAEIAVKVQYPGVRASIDSDVNNVATLLRLSGLVPRSLDVAPLLAEAKAQLHEEADYLREAQALADFGALLADDPGFRVPGLRADLTTRDVLAMEYVASDPIESLATAPQATRDAAMTRLAALTLRELFAFHRMQTDPNFANYRVENGTGRIVLLDFGATRAFEPEVAARFHALMEAGLEGDAAALEAAAIGIGYFSAETDARPRAAVLGLIELAMGYLRRPEPFAFARTDLVTALRDKGIALADEREFWHIPPVDTLFLHRKFAGLFLLGRRLDAVVDLGALLAPWRAGLAGSAGRGQDPAA